MVPPVLPLMFSVELKIPFRLAEKRRSSWGFRGVLSEGEARVSHPAYSIEHRREPEGQACRWPFFWYLFFGHCIKKIEWLN